MDLWKVLRLVSLVQLKLISKTDRTIFPKWGRLPLPFEWVLQFQVLTASPSCRNEGLLSPSLQFQLLQKSTWKDGCESLKKKNKRQKHSIPVSPILLQLSSLHIESELTVVQEKESRLLTKYHRSRGLCCWWEVEHASYRNSLHGLLPIPPCV